MDHGAADNTQTRIESNFPGIVTAIMNHQRRLWTGAGEVHEVQQKKIKKLGNIKIHASSLDCLDVLSNLFYKREHAYRNSSNSGRNQTLSRPVTEVSLTLKLQQDVFKN